MRKQRLNAMKQTRSMTSATSIHSFIIRRFFSVSRRSWASLRSLVSSTLLIDANRRSAALKLCAPDDEDVRRLVSSMSRMLHSTSDVDLRLVSSFRWTLASLFSNWSDWPSRPCRSLCSLRRIPCWCSSLFNCCSTVTGLRGISSLSANVASPSRDEDGYFSCRNNARWPQT